MRQGWQLTILLVVTWGFFAMSLLEVWSCLNIGTGAGMNRSRQRARKIGDRILHVTALVQKPNKFVIHHDSHLLIVGLDWFENICCNSFGIWIFHETGCDWKNTSFQNNHEVKRALVIDDSFHSWARNLYLCYDPIISLSSIRPCINEDLFLILGRNQSRSPNYYWWSSIASFDIPLLRQFPSHVRKPCITHSC